MKASLLLVPATLLCFAFACSSSSDSHGDSIATGGDSSGGSGASGGASGSTHVTGHAGSSGHAEGGATDGGASGEGGADAGSAGLEQGMVVTVTPSACSQAGNWTGAAPLMGVSTTADEELLAVTPDELDIVFTRDAALFRAHRATALSDFDAGSAITIPGGYDALSGASLSADGKTLVLGQTDGQGFAALTRDARTGDFGAAADATAFVGLNERAVQTAEHYLGPVLAPNGKTFVFGAFSPAAPGAPAHVYESALANGVWSMPDDISQYIFDGTTEKHVIPSSLSSDSRTLFYYDEALAQEVARFRDRPDAPLYTVVNLGGRVGIESNTACNHIYYSAAGNVLTEAN